MHRYDMPSKQRRVLPANQQRHSVLGNGNADLNAEGILHWI